VLQVAANSPAARVIGLELSGSRLEQAELALQQLQEQGVELQPVQFRQADLSSCDLTEGTHFYMCSTAFGAGICRWAQCMVQCMVQLQSSAHKRRAAGFCMLQTAWNNCLV
jgi:hypothetical protein